VSRSAADVERLNLKVTDGGSMTGLPDPDWDSGTAMPAPPAAPPPAPPEPEPEPPRASPPPEPSYRKAQIGRGKHFRDLTTSDAADRALAEELLDRMDNPEVVDLLERAPLNDVQIRHWKKFKWAGQWDPGRAIRINNTPARTGVGFPGEREAFTYANTFGTQAKVKELTLTHEIGHQMHLGLFREFAETDPVREAAQARVRSVIQSAWQRQEKAILDWQSAAMKPRQMPVVSRYAMTNDQEYFAENFVAWTENRAQLAEIDPIGVQMVDEVVTIIRGLPKKVQ
jgi:hypothetical protein